MNTQEQQITETTYRASYTDEGTIEIQYRWASQTYDEGEWDIAAASRFDADGGEWVGPVDAILSGFGYARTGEWDGDYASLRELRELDNPMMGGGVSAQRYEIEAWLGGIEATAEQIETLMQVSDLVAARYGDDAQEQQTAAMSAALQVVLGDDTLDQIGARWRASRESERQSMAELTGAMIAASQDMSQSEVGRVAGVDRMTVRKALGLR